MMKTVVTPPCLGGVFQFRAKNDPFHEKTEAEKRDSEDAKTPVATTFLRSDARSP